MWIPSEDEAVEMFARHFEALHRSGAATKAELTASQLSAGGDQEGHRIWSRVAEQIKHLRQHDRLAQRRTMEAA